MSEMPAFSKLLAALILMAAACIPISVAAQEKLFLSCDWIESTDVLEDKTTPTSGSAFYLFNFRSPTSGTAKKQGLGAEFDFTADEIELIGSVRYSMSGMAMSQQFNINRFTGKITSWFQVGKRALMHTGQCKTLPGRQF